MKRPRRPAPIEPHVADRMMGGVDPAVTLQIAHDTATALVHRIREADDPEVFERLLAYTENHGVGELAELWAAAPAHSLPGALWRLYVVHASIVKDEVFAATAYETGAAVEATADAVVAGAPQPTTPADIRALADEILRGAFHGDMGDALDRGAAYCRIEARGITDIIGQSELGNSLLLQRALTLTDFADDLNACAKLDRNARLL
ncbi:MAG: DNA-directed RNA polymerase subunit beta [Microbacteriaceae bacterium]